MSILQVYSKAFLQVTFLLNHRKIKDTFCQTQALSFMLRSFGKRGADTFTKRSQGFPRRKLVWWQCTRWPVSEASRYPRSPLFLTSDFCVCVGGIFWVMVSLSSPIKLEGTPGWLHKMDFVVLSLPTGGSQVSSQMETLDRQLEVKTPLCVNTSRRRHIFHFTLCRFHFQGS